MVRLSSKVYLVLHYPNWHVILNFKWGGDGFQIYGSFADYPARHLPFRYHQKERNSMRKIAIVSTKGGVGKTTITANLATSLSNLNYKVGALDLDSSSPTLHLAFNLSEPPEWGVDTAKEQIIPSRLSNGIDLVTMASHWGLGNRVSWRGNEKGDLTKQLLGDIVGWSNNLDFITIDSPPSMSEEIFILAEDKTISGYIIVTQPQLLSVADVERLIDFCRAEALPIFGIVSNFDGCVSPQGEFFYPYLGERVDIEEWSEKHKIPFLASIPQCNNQEQLSSVFAELANKVIDAKPIKLPRHEKRKKFKREALKILLEKKDE